MSEYVVVTRRGKHPISRHMSVRSAGNYIYRERAFDRWTVLAQDERPGPASRFRELRPIEKRELERALYPSLWD